MKHLQFMAIQIGIICLGLLLTTTPICAQEIDYPCQKQIEKGQFEKVLPKLQKQLSKEPNDCETLYALYCYYDAKENAEYNLREAYRQLGLAEESFANSEEKVQKKLTKHGYSPELFSVKFEALSQAGLEVAQKENTIDAYNDYLSFYKKASSQQISAAKTARNTLAFAEAQKQNTIEAYKQFIATYPEATLVPQAQNHIYELAHNEATKANTIRAYHQFLVDYPEAPQVAQVRTRIYNMAYEEAVAKNTEDAYRTYANQYPESHMRAKALQQAEALHAAQLLATLPENPDAETLKRALSEWDGAAKDTCLLKLRNIYAGQNDIEGLRSLYKEYDAPCLDQVKATDIAAIEAHDQAIREAEEAKRAAEEAKRIEEEKKRAAAEAKRLEEEAKKAELAEKKRKEEQYAIESICDLIRDEFGYYDYDGMSYSNVYAEDNNIILVLSADEYYMFGGYNMMTAFRAAGYTEKKFANEMKRKIIKGNTDKQSKQMIATLRKYKYNLIWRIVGNPSGDTVDVKIGYNEWPK